MSMKINRQRAVRHSENPSNLFYGAMECLADRNVYNKKIISLLSQFPASLIIQTELQGIQGVIREY